MNSKDYFFKLDETLYRGGMMVAHFAVYDSQTGQNVPEKDFFIGLSAVNEIVDQMKSWHKRDEIRLHYYLGQMQMAQRMLGIEIKFLNMIISGNVGFRPLKALPMPKPLRITHQPS